MKYHIALMAPDGKIIGKARLLTLWNDTNAVEARAKAIGVELAHDAMDHAGRDRGRND